MRSKDYGAVPPKVKPAPPPPPPRTDFGLERLARITEIIEAVENRCMAADGPVANTRLEMTDAEMRQIYQLASGSYRRRRKES